MEKRTVRYGFFILVISMAFMGCAREVVNSTSNDELIASLANLPGNAKFKAAIPAIHTKCASCHTHAAWYGYGEQDYANNGLVVNGSLAGSKLYYRLSNATQGPGPKNMPQGGAAALTNEELDKLIDWITFFGSN
jgi:uncharacterized membrane protein